MKRIGIDLGGTKIEGVVVDEALNVEHKLRLPTPATDGYDAVIQQVGKVVTELEAMHGGTMQGRHWHPRSYFSGHRAYEEQQQCRSEWQASERGPRARIRTTDPYGQRRELFRLI